ncbi:hypothetical protein [Abyssibacter profundi]|uniref:Uncharacterized protein n=1 Tax=Abyssibacter profundi TaxID=2182787 RepID=A0A383XR36_9GAMM|nr:hypothetical protein [Abyssibacter profundi]PWN55090.1 hypothetical protein DEH80_13755 [Abyssibacter profundi]
MPSRFVLREAAAPTVLGPDDGACPETLLTDGRYILEMIAVGGEIIRVRAEQRLGDELHGIVVGVQRYDAKTARRMAVPGSRSGDVESGQRVHFLPEHVQAIIDVELCAAHDRRQAQRPTIHARRSSDRSQSLRSA